jgi:peptidoglycan/LPS O-acetylase OafA/YrhL
LAYWLLAIIALMVLEGLALGALWRFRNQGVNPAQLAVNLLAGISLLLVAVTVALGAGGTWLLACLAFALVMHVLDLRMRWRS